MYIYIDTHGQRGSHVTISGTPEELLRSTGSAQQAASIFQCHFNAMMSLGCSWRSFRTRSRYLGPSTHFEGPDLMHRCLQMRFLTGNAAIIR